MAVMAWQRAAGDPGGCGGVGGLVEERVVEPARKQRHRIVTPGTEPRCDDVPVALEQRAAGLEDAETIGRVVERGQAVGARRPPFVNIVVALPAVVVVVEVAGRDRPPVGRPRQRRRELPLVDRGRAPARRAVRGTICRSTRATTQPAAGRRQPPAVAPSDRRSGEAVENEQPARNERDQHVRPVGGRAQPGVGDVEDTFEAGEHDAAGHQHDERREQRQTGTDGAAVGVVDAAPQVGDGKGKSRDDEDADPAPGARETPPARNGSRRSGRRTSSGRG